MELTKIQLQIIWDKAKTALHMDDAKYRKDAFGNLIFKASYGKRSKMGWELDRSHPAHKGEVHNPKSLAAIHWKHSRESSDSFVKK